jgi:uncharacterized membrane protein (DUF485 family)
MRFSITPFSHSEYSALRKQSESLALLWGIGHAFFVLFLTFALVAPIAVAMAATIEPEISSERARDVAGSSMIAGLLISAIGVLVKWYANKKGKRSRKIR